MYEKLKKVVKIYKYTASLIFTVILIITIYKILSR